MPKKEQLLQKAVGLHQSGQLAEAERAYHKLLRGDKNNIDGLRLLGGLYIQTQRHAQAYDFLNKANKFRPGDPEILNNLGIAVRNLGRMDEAADYYRRAIAARPDYPQALHNLGSAYYQKGNIAEAEKYYRQALCYAPDYAQAHYNLANTLRDRNQFEEAIAHYEAALKTQPNYIDALINLALTHNQRGESDKAIAVYGQVLKLQPHNVVALNNYGNLLRSLGRFKDAKMLYEKALALKPDYINAHTNLGTVNRDLGDLDAAHASYRHVLELEPDMVAALNNLGTLMQDFGRLEDAAALYDRALRIEPDSIEALWNRALVHLGMGQYAEGWRLYDKGIGIPDKRGKINFDPRRLWDGKDFPGKRLLICAEQGLGDSLQFIRYAAVCKRRGGEVYVGCPDSLHRLFANNPAIDKTVSTIEPQAADLFIPMMSLPRIFGTTLETIPANIPYLSPNAATRAKWQALVPGDGIALKVGLVWAGGKREHQPFMQLIDNRRSMHLAQFGPLFNLAGRGVVFYNLQIGPQAAQIAELGLQDRIIDLTAGIKDFEDTAGLVERLDLVIAVDTSIVHLAGGLGTPVWVLSRLDACWRWLRNRQDSPWYPSLRVYGQQAHGEWGGVISNILRDLKAISNKEV